MKTVVSHGTILVDGVPACAKCGRRPRRPVPPTAKATRRTGRKFYSYCTACHSEYVWERRRGKTELLVREEDRGLVHAIGRAELSDEERELVVELLVELRAAPAGRHRASAVFS